MCDGMHTFFRYEAFFTILENSKLKLTIIYLFSDWANTKTIIPISVGDQWWIFTSLLCDLVIIHC